MKKKYKTTVVAILLFFITVTSIGVLTFAEPKKLSREQVRQSVERYNSKIEFDMDELNKSKEQILEEENALKNNEKYLTLTEENVNVYYSGEVSNTVKKMPLNFSICTGYKKFALGAKEKLTEIKEKIKKDHEELEKNNKVKALIEESEKYLKV